MIEAAFPSSLSRQDHSVLPWSQKKRKGQVSRRQKKEVREVTVWFCCYCGHGGMTHHVPGCANCNTPSCNFCRWEKIEIDWKQQKQATYTWRKDAALLSLTPTEPQFFQPPDLRNAPTTLTCTNPEPGPTYDPQEGLIFAPISDHVTQQSLNNHSLHTQGDTHVSPTIGPAREFELSSLSLNEADTISLSADPPFVTSSVPKQAADSPHSLQHQENWVEETVVAIDKWNAEGTTGTNGFSSQTIAGPPVNIEWNRLKPPHQVRKRTSDRSITAKHGSAKRAKTSSDPPPQAKQDDGQLLACPFWKKDPIKHRDCFKGLKRISDVKQHLKRRHRKPVFCWRCGVKFENGTELKKKERLRKHATAAYQCAPRHFHDPDGITSGQEVALSGYSDRSTDEAQQWYVIWDYCFPVELNGNPPLKRPSSPYVGGGMSEDLLAFLEFSGRKGWGAMASCDDPDVNDAALSISEELLQKCLDRIYDRFLAEKGTGPQSPHDENPLALSESGTSDERAPTSDTAPIDEQVRDDAILELGQFPEGLGFEDNFAGPQIDVFFDDFATPSVDINTAQMFPSVPLLTSDHGMGYALPVATLDPSLISR